MAKTRLDLILDKVKCGEREVTFDLYGYTADQVARVRKAARERGLNVSGTERWVLVRDLSCTRRR